MGFENPPLAMRDVVLTNTSPYFFQHFSLTPLLGGEGGCLGWQDFRNIFLVSFFTVNGLRSFFYSLGRDFFPLQFLLGFFFCWILGLFFALWGGEWRKLLCFFAFSFWFFAFQCFLVQRSFAVVFSHFFHNFFQLFFNGLSTNCDFLTSWSMVSAFF